MMALGIGWIGSFSTWAQKAFKFIGVVVQILCGTGRSVGSLLGGGLFISPSFGGPTVLSLEEGEARRDAGS